MIFRVTKDKANKLLAKAFRDGNFAPAISAYEKLRKKTPSDYELLNNLAVAYLEACS